MLTAPSPNHVCGNEMHILNPFNNTDSPRPCPAQHPNSQAQPLPQQLTHRFTHVSQGPCKQAMSAPCLAHCLCLQHLVRAVPYLEPCLDHIRGVRHQACQAGGPCTEEEQASNVRSTFMGHETATSA